MIILKQCNRICIVADEKDMMDGKKNIMFLYQGRTYSSDFSCISDSNAKPLYPHLRTEYTDNKDEVEREFENKVNLLRSYSKNHAPAGNPALEELLKKTIESVGNLRQVHEVKTPSGSREIHGTIHECFDKVLKLVNMDIPVFLSGPAGSGKNVICKQIADALGFNFYFTNAVTQEYQLKGFIDANGTFHETQFYKAFTQGGLFFLDEMDGSIPETLIILNAAIANRYFDFPTGKVDAHPDFRVIAAGNTVGTGADIEYTGRFQLDASSLDRFALITVDYSPSIEQAVTNNNFDLCSFARTFRKITATSGIRCLFTYRSLDRITKLENVFPLNEVLQMSLTKGLTKDDLNIIVCGFANEGIKNKYVEALKKIA